MTTIFYSHQRDIESEASIIDGPPTHPNFLIHVQYLLIRFLPWHTTWLLADYEILSTPGAVHYTVFDNISSSNPGAAQYKLFLADFLFDIIHRRSFLWTRQFTFIRPLTRSLFGSKLGKFLSNLFYNSSSRGCLPPPFYNFIFWRCLSDIFRLPYYGCVKGLHIIS